MTQHSSADWVAQFLADEPPRSKSLVMTLFGDAIAPHGGAVWLGSLIEMAAPFGINDRLLRTSVYRLAQEGWLGATRDGRRSAYAILPEALPRFERAYRRIYAPLRQQWDGTWIVLLPAGTLEAPLRLALRKELLWEGYAMLGNGIFAHPGGELDVLDDLLARVGAKDKLFACAARELPQLAARPLRALVEDGWDLGAAAAGYAHFIGQFAPLLEIVRAEPGLTPAQAFVIRTLLIHAYRRVQLHDPQLPLALLPTPWPGSQAYALAGDLYRACHGPSEQHIMSLMQREDAGTPPAAASFFARFGGLA